MQLIKIFILILILSQSAIAATANIPKQAIEALQKEFPDHYQHPVFGDLNQDGIDDFAVLINPSEGGEKIAVFFGQKDNNYKIFTVSGETGLHQRVYRLIKIENKSLYLHRDGSGGCCSHWAEDFQFQMRNEDLILIGEESTEFVNGMDTEPNDAGKSINYLTDEVIYWRKVGKKYKEIKKKFPAVKHINLNSFYYWDHSDRLPKELKGYIDDNDDLIYIKY